MNYTVLAIGGGELPWLQDALGEQCQLTMVADAHAALSAPCLPECQLLLVMDETPDPAPALAEMAALKAAEATAHLPMVVLATEEHDLDTRLAFYDAGCHDYLTYESASELQVRLTKVIFNRIANEQLKKQLKEANEMAFIAMSDTSDLGVNIQFLLDINHCDNLDEAGMRLFQALKSYHINGSLQIRSRFGVKNMEANGMAKDLESTLLSECADKGRYVDFGRRSIMNYGNVSLLVRNMPVNDDKKYGAIKDNVFSLLQGLDARVSALDNVESLRLESQLVVRLAGQMSALMESVDQGYHDVMVRIADVVEDLADGIDSEIQFLGMDEQQERAIQQRMENGIIETNRVFNEGLRMDKGISSYLNEVGRVFAAGHTDANELQTLMDNLPSIGRLQ